MVHIHLVNFSQILFHPLRNTINLRLFSKIAICKSGFFFCFVFNSENVQESSNRNDSNNNTEQFLHLVISSLSYFLKTQETYGAFQKLLFVNISNDKVLGRYLQCKCSKSIPFGAYSKTMIFVKGSSSSQYPRRLTKLLWLTFHNVSIWNHSNRNN